jgi:hypothetical protein
VLIEDSVDDAQPPLPRQPGLVTVSAIAASHEFKKFRLLSTLVSKVYKLAPDNQEEQ